MPQINHNVDGDSQHWLTTPHNIFSDLLMDAFSSYIMHAWEFGNHQNERPQRCTEECCRGKVRWPRTLRTVEGRAITSLSDYFPLLLPTALQSSPTNLGATSLWFASQGPHAAQGQDVSIRVWWIFCRIQSRAPHNWCTTTSRNFIGSFTIDEIAAFPRRFRKWFRFVK